MCKVRLCCYFILVDVNKWRLLIIIFDVLKIVCWFVKMCF